MRNERHEYADKMTEDELRVLLSLAERMTVWQAAWTVEWLNGDHPEIVPPGGFVGGGIEALPSTPGNVIAYFTHDLYR